MSIETVDSDIALSFSDWLKTDSSPDNEKDYALFFQQTIARLTHIYSSADRKPLNSIQSAKFIVGGNRSPSGHILWINGINNSFEESRASGSYIQSLSGGETVTGIYNFSHGPIADLFKTAFINHMGFSPITALLLQKEWEAFHVANANRPNLKILQVCHSQGAIHVKNALQNSPQEIRDRIIVVAIAPAAIVPAELCFQSYNYGSEKDFIPKLSPVRPLQPIDDVIIPRFEKETATYRDELILLSPHPLAENFDHSFQSPTYLEALENRLEDYKLHGGEYLPQEKGSIEK